MENYKRVLKKRMFFCSVVVLFDITLNVIRQFGLWKFKSENVSAICFLGALLTALCLAALYCIYRYRAALKDEKKLEILYNAEHDERKMLIRQKAGMPMLLVTSAIMIFAGVIAGYFNEIIFYTLVLAAIVQMTVGAIVKIYYMKKL